MKQQVIRTACLRICTGHIESAEWLVADYGACAAPVEVQITDMEVLARFFLMSAIACDDRSC